MNNPLFARLFHHPPPVNPKSALACFAVFLLNFLFFPDLRQFLLYAVLITFSLTSSLWSATTILHLVRNPHYELLLVTPLSNWDLASGLLLTLLMRMRFWFIFFLALLPFVLTLWQVNSTSCPPEWIEQWCVADGSIQPNQFASAVTGLLYWGGFLALSLFGLMLGVALALSLPNPTLAAALAATIQLFVVMFYTLGTLIQPAAPLHQPILWAIESTVFSALMLWALAYGGLRAFHLTQDETISTVLALIGSILFLALGQSILAGIPETRLALLRMGCVLALPYLLIAITGMLFWRGARHN